MNQQRFSLRSYVAIARVDHWFKQVFCLPGVVMAVLLDGLPLTIHSAWNLGIGLLATCLTASSNYVVNEIYDAPTDRSHPIKRDRPIPSGHVSLSIAYVEWLTLGALGLATAWLVNRPFFYTTLWLWIMGLVYNIPPVRAKELPVVDVLCEAVNNPIRLLLGWYAMGAQRVTPLSLICAYWMLGAFLMAAKRFAEFRQLADPAVAAAYRRSFKRYNENRLLALMVLYMSCFSLMLGIFLIKYRVELILSVPFIAAFLAIYFDLAMRPDSPVQMPEKLYREKRLMLACFVVTAVCMILCLVDMPFLAKFFEVHVPQW